VNVFGLAQCPSGGTVNWRNAILRDYPTFARELGPITNELQAAMQMRLAIEEGQR